MSQKEDVMLVGGPLGGQIVSVDAVALMMRCEPKDCKPGDSVYVYVRCSEDRKRFIFQYSTIAEA